MHQLFECGAYLSSGAYSIMYSTALFENSLHFVAQCSVHFTAIAYPFSWQKPPIVAFSGLYEILQPPFSS